MSHIHKTCLEQVRIKGVGTAFIFFPVLSTCCSMWVHWEGLSLKEDFHKEPTASLPKNTARFL